MKSAAVMAFAAGLLGLASAVLLFQSVMSRRKESTKPTTWDDVQSVRRFTRPSRNEVAAMVLMVASSVLGLASALSG
jgi:hypothetical protein